MSKTSEDYELFHYGVKGMRWGVRRPVDSATGLIKKGTASAKTGVKNKVRQPKTEEAKSANKSRKQIKKHGTDSMTNAELKKVVNRMNLEQQYSQLLDNEKASSRRAGASRYVSDILKDVGAELAREVIIGGVKYAAGRYTGRRTGSGGSYRFRTQPALPPGGNRLITR